MNIKFRSFLISCFSFLTIVNVQATALDPSSPATTVNSIIKGVVNYQPEVIWSALPKSYQVDINKLLTSFSRMTEKDVFDKYNNLVRRLLAAVKQKKSMIVNTIKKMAPPDKQASIIPALDAVILYVDVFYNSPFTYYDQIDKADLGKIIVKDGSKLMKAFLAIDQKFTSKFKELGNFNAKEVSRQGTEVTLSMLNKQIVINPKIVFVQVEGRWIPKDLSVNWKMFIAKAGSQAQLPKEKLKEINAKLRKILPILEQFVASIEKVKNEAELATLPLQAMVLVQQIKAIK